ncbi:hypothetical protein Tco_1107110 [Tanacetum coccineum]
MERKIDEWLKSQNISSGQTDRTDPPPPQAHTEQVNAVFTESEKSDYSLKILKDPPPPIIVNNKIEKDKPIKTSEKGYHVVKTKEYPFHEYIPKMPSKTTTNASGIKPSCNTKKDNDLAKHQEVLRRIKHSNAFAESIGNVTISRVYYVEGLGHNLFSVRQFCDSNLEVAFRQHTCFIRNLEARTPVFVRVFLSLKFEKDHLCYAYAWQKQEEPPTTLNLKTSQEKLYLLTWFFLPNACSMSLWKEVPPRLVVITLDLHDYPIWEVIQNGNGPVSITTDTSGQIKVLPPRTAEEIVARERERKARTTLLMALPEDHLAKFHKMTDAKEMWDAIKSRFGGNDRIPRDAKLEIHGAGVSTEDANQKFLRSLPSAWSQVSLIMRTKPGVDSLRLGKIDDMTLKKWDLEWISGHDLNENEKFYKKNWSVESGISRQQERDALNSGNKVWGEWTEGGFLKHCSVTIDGETQTQSANAKFWAWVWDTQIGCFAEGMHAVPPPMTGNYMPSGPEIEIYYSQFTYGPKQTQPSESESQSSDLLHDYTHRALKNKGIVDSGCSRHMTRNKAYLAEFQDFNGSPVAFGGSDVKRIFSIVTLDGAKYLTGNPQTEVVNLIRQAVLIYSAMNEDHWSGCGLLYVQKPDSLRILSLNYIRIYQALISLLNVDSTLSSTMDVHDSCPENNMVAYWRSLNGNAEFHDVH